MKVLDKYVAKNFVVGYAIAFLVLIGMRIIIDLFVNLDEFAEHIGELGALGVMKNIFIFYSVNITLYFRDFAGVITVVAAAFSLGKMVRCNELVAVMSSGVSLKRIAAPVLFLSLLLTALVVVDQELIIPSVSEKLVRKPDFVPGQETYSVWFISDGNGSLICSQRFELQNQTLYQPTIITRTREDKSITWKVSGLISADKAIYDPHIKKWKLINGTFISKDAQQGRRVVKYYESKELVPKDIPVRLKAGYETLLSSRQLAALANQKTKLKDVAQLYSQKHFRITDPIINFVALMISLPVLLCRDPKAIKSAVLVSFSLTCACYVVTFIAKMLATESLFNGRVMPELWAWLPVLIFMPIAFVELDSMKT